ncbi:hypothetical protein KKH39_03330 [Patescibacteria group bacterium]|nr:hypothetical protein [Patescibacteria group bacterium]
MKKLFIITSLVILASFSALVANAEVNTSSTEPVVVLDVCDHNNDGRRSLIDVGMLAECADTYDLNGDNVHSLTDVAMYYANSQSETCMATFVCNPQPVDPTPDDEVVVSDPLTICDHNGDGVTSLSDVGMFAQCKDTFDADGNGIHELADIALYATNYSDTYWCQNTFVCNPDNSTSQNDNTPQSVGSGAGIPAPDASLIEAKVSCDNVDISWDTSKDSLTWLVYGESSNYGQEYKSEDYTSNHLVSLTELPYDTTYNYMVKTIAVSGNQKDDYDYTFTTPSAEQCGLVLGEKIENEEPVVGDEETQTCEYMTPDQDVLGQTQWADGTLLRGCGPEIYIVEDQQKRHIKSLEELFNYIGQRIHNVTNDILALF